MKVYKSPCKNCLLSEDRIVSPSRASEIIKHCVRNQTHFICHKASIEGEDICCSTFFNQFGHYIQNARIASRLGVLKFVDQPDSERLASYQDLKNREK